MAKTFKWTVEFTVDEVWVADGFDLTDEIAQEMVANWLSHSYPHETDAKVIKSPARVKIRKAQGYSAAAE